jgi:3-oxoacyl-[acyl-carrier protein] reductase
MVAKIQEQLGGGVDILVNNAYPGGVHGKVQSGWADFQNSWSTIVQGGANCINAVLPGMVSKKWGRIINIGSFTLWYARNNAHYTTAKGALLALTRSVAHDYGQFNITANTISPGPIWMDSNSPQPIGDMGLHAALSPLRRLPTSEDVAKAAVFFASNMADGITGANLPVCGGLIMN